VDHASAEGWLTPGESTVLDPFGGVGLGGLPCALRGIQWLGCELEPRFVTLACGGACGGDSEQHAMCTDAGVHGPHHILGNLELWQRRYGGLAQWVQPRLIQGDSRRLQAVLREQVKCVMSSPPYSGNEKHDYRITDAGGRDRDERRGHKQGLGCFRGSETYGQTAGNLGTMDAGSLAGSISSPPYGDQQVGTGGEGRSGWRGYTDHGGGTRAHSAQLAAMPTSDTRNTFWSAAQTILEQVFALLKPGGVAIWVTKPYVRKKQLVDFPGEWRTACEHVGFHTLHEHRAMLKEEWSVPDLFEGEWTYAHWKESFFRRLARKSTGIGIPFEIVHCMGKPLTAGPMPPAEVGEHLPLGARHVAISSPPYGGAGEVLATHQGIDYSKAHAGGKHRTPARAASGVTYSAHPANLGAMPAGRAAGRQTHDPG